MMNRTEDTKEIEERYRAYCDACQSNHLELVPTFWKLPALFVVDGGTSDILHTGATTAEELINLYSAFFGPSTGIDKTVIDKSEVTFYGDQLAMIKTSLRHFAGEKLHDTQQAIYGCRKIQGEWFFLSHLSVEAV